jgi:hypothetical protein
MRRTLTAFLGGLIVGAAAVVAGGYVAVFERPGVPLLPPLPPLPQIAVARPQQLPQTGWEDFVTVERRIPKDLQKCVANEAMAQNQRPSEAYQRWQREQAFVLEKALGACLAMQKPPKTLARK